jgi:metallopeptidase MepB
MLELVESKAPPQSRPTFATSATVVANTTKQLIEASRRKLDQIVAGTSAKTASFENVLLPMAHCRNSMAVEARILSFYKEVSSDANLRNESRNSKLLFDDFEIEIGMREDLFLLVDSVVKKNQDLDLESKRLLRAEHRNFQANGLALPKNHRDRFKEIKLRLNEATGEFRKNMIEENGYVEFCEEDMAGVPADVLRSARLDGDPSHNGEKFRLTFQPTHFYPTLRYAQSTETRKRYLIAYENRCINNVPLFREVVLLRDEAARLLGYANHAAWRTEGLMAGTPENVLTFLQDLRSQLQSSCQAELEALKRLKCNHLGDQGVGFDGKLYVWDISFYHRLMLET